MIGHEVSVFDLMQALCTLPPNWMLVPNSVSNISIFNSHRKYVGYVDFLKDVAGIPRVHLFVEEDE